MLGGVWLQNPAAFQKDLVDDEYRNIGQGSLIQKSEIQDAPKSATLGTTRGKFWAMKIRFMHKII
jgi:hypothetical protein